MVYILANIVFFWECIVRRGSGRGEWTFPERWTDGWVMDGWTDVPERRVHQGPVRVAGGSTKCCRWVETLQVGSGFMWEGLQIGL